MILILLNLPFDPSHFQNHIMGFVLIFFATAPELTISSNGEEYNTFPYKLLSFHSQQYYTKVQNYRYYCGSPNLAHIR